MKRLTVLILTLSLLIILISCGTKSTDTNEKTDNVVYALGQPVTINDWEVTVDDVSVVQSVEDKMATFTPDEDTDQFLSVALTIKNNDSKKRVFSPMDKETSEAVIITLINDDKYEYEPTMLSGYEEELFNSVVDPISTKTGKLHFSYPKDMGDLTDNMVIRIVSGENEADISLNQISNAKKETKNETQAAEEQSSASSEEDTSQNFDASNAVIGTWISDDESTSFTFNQDGTCEISCDFEYNEGTYIIDGNRLILSSGLVYTYWFDNGALILKNDYFEYTCYRVVI